MCIEIDGYDKWFSSTRLATASWYKVDLGGIESTLEFRTTSKRCLKMSFLRTTSGPSPCSRSIDFVNDYLSQVCSDLGYPSAIGTSSCPMVRALEQDIAQ